jgi:hypothetical protein
MYFPAATVSLFQTPVPNYKDVDLSFSYKYFRSAFDFAKMDLATPYDFGGEIMTVMTNIVEQQCSSPQLQEFIRLTKLHILIAYTDMP